MALVTSRLNRRLLLALCACAAAWAVVGCGDSTGKLVPVVGKVTVNGQPLTTGTGTVSFRPLALD